MKPSQKTNFVFLFFIVGMLFLVSCEQNENKLTGYAVSNIFTGTAGDSQAMGYVAREGGTDTNGGYSVESTILLPSGQFSAAGYVVTIPYLGDASDLPPEPPDLNYQCSDTFDNDNDGKIDSADEGCHTNGVATDPATYSAMDNDERYCGDGFKDDNEECDGGADCLANCRNKPPENNGGGSPGGGGGGGGNFYSTICDQEYECGNWGECRPDNLQRRTCNPSKECSEAYRRNAPEEIWGKNKPPETKSCVYNQPETPKQEPERQPEVLPQGPWFYVLPQIDKKYKAEDTLVLVTYVRNDNIGEGKRLEIEYNINDDTGTKYVDYHGTFTVSPAEEFTRTRTVNLKGYKNKIYKIHAVLYQNGANIKESDYNLDLR